MQIKQWILAGAAALCLCACTQTATGSYDIAQQVDEFNGLDYAPGLHKPYTRTIFSTHDF